MLENARIWSRGAALMRAQVLKCPGFRPIESHEDLLFTCHSKTKFRVALELSDDARVFRKRPVVRIE